MNQNDRKTPDPMSAVGQARDEPTELKVRAQLQELQLHTEEITVHNQQLVRAQSELEQARDRYANLYDFAPIGYVTLDWDGRIVEINFAGAQLLGQDRRFLIDMPLPSLIVPDDRDRLRDFLRRSGPTDGTLRQVDVTTENPAGILRLLARPLGKGADPREILTAMLDVTAERRLEAERQAAHEREQQKRAELAREIAKRITTEERVKALLDRLVNVQEQERRRLAMNLHDQLGQQLTALRLTIGAIKEAVPDGADARTRFELVDKIVNRLDRDVDFLAWELRPAALDDVGLEAALHEFVRQWSWTQGIQAEFHATEGQWPRLPTEIESHLYRILQEALNNVSKHAAAKHVSVLLERRRDEVTLIVEDDGSGFDPEQVQRRKHDSAMGLTGMHERAASIGGEMHCESSPGNGTTLFVRVPVRESAHTDPS